MKGHGKGGRVGREGKWEGRESRKGGRVGRQGKWEGRESGKGERVGREGEWERRESGKGGRGRVDELHKMLNFTGREGVGGPYIHILQVSSQDSHWVCILQVPKSDCAVLGTTGKVEALGTNIQAPDRVTMTFVRHNIGVGVHTPEADWEQEKNSHMGQIKQM